jgi:hypothetical protein
VNRARKLTFDSLRPGDTVPETGIYKVLHRNNCSSKIAEMILKGSQLCPACRVCGEKVRFRLLHSMPHIYEDPDFKR